MEWELFRTFDAVVQTGSLTAAARRLGVSQSTVSRHMARLESQAASPLIIGTQPLLLTDRGRALVKAARSILDAALSAEVALQTHHEVRGEVTVTTVAEIARWYLAPNVRHLFKRYPELSLRILTTNQISSLASGEADVSIRLMRPMSGDLYARKLADIEYDVYAATGLNVRPDTPWLGLAGSVEDVPDQKVARLLFEGRTKKFACEDLEALTWALADGLGIALLPKRAAALQRGLSPVQDPQFSDRLPCREIWLVTHRTRRSLASVRAVFAWLETLDWDERGSRALLSRDAQSR
ncbi:MAG: LysR family transcriptional regulator [Myxococcota bacterium]